MSLAGWIGWTAVGLVAGVVVKGLVGGRANGNYDGPLLAISAGFLIGSKAGGRILGAPGKAAFGGCAPSR